jgi:tRNA(Ile)-lysidine synthase
LRVTSGAQQGLAAEEFAGLMAPFGPFEARPVLAVGVSGGRDSLALAILAGEWAATRGGRVLGLIVDHGLRPESAAEAATTRDLLARHGIASEVLRWPGSKPGGGLQAAARTARYGLLFEACRRHAILHLLVAHHADDQAETVAIRMARASGPDGLAGMAGLVEHREGRLLRPLLSIPRTRLTATLLERAIPWIDDPSNADPRFERARLRRGAPLPAVEISIGLARATREGALAERAVPVLDLDVAGGVAIDHASFLALDAETQARLLARVIQAVGRRDHPPRGERLERAVARLSRARDGGKSGKGQDFTLSECRLALRRVRGETRLRWIVTSENGRKDTKKSGQPLIPAIFFACGVRCTSHLDRNPHRRTDNREPVQP